ncbi:MAG TPA: hypothetical protein VMH37_19135, partial [Candidatus Binataceae bacterium]|nr:hypothetical protein [Candidatus Binataceae bacterium]
AMLWSLAVALCGILPACNNSQTGFGGFVGNTPPVPPSTGFKVLGDVGVPFALTISNANSSWNVYGVVPENIWIVNNTTPVRMIATKLANNNSLLSLEIDNGGTILTLESTTAAYGLVSIQTPGGTLNTIQPQAVPDLRIYVNGPLGQRFQALVEDSNIGFITNTRAPAVFLFDGPEGKVDGQFTQTQNFGSFSINMTSGVNGTNEITTASGGPFVIIRQP